jgi:glycosyltransferase involved in cell wall biosynthesis
MTQPLISIVIVNYNYGRFLEEAITSILGQSCQDFELLIVDGGSTDNSVEIIKKYETRLAWWCSEPDKGQSEAFNKGFEKASGKFLTWLNADDLLLPGALAAFAKKACKYPECEWFTGNLYRFQNDGVICEVNWGPHVFPSILQRRDAPVVVFGPTSFFSKNIYEQVGRIDESLNFMMDTDLWLKFMHADIRQIRINHYCWAFRLHTESKTSEFDGHILDEKTKAKFCLESERVMTARGYKMSKLMYVLLLCVRILDGSFLLAIYYKMRLLNRAIRCMPDDKRKEGSSVVV